ncbi:cytochrome P450 [Aspergillus mulundensis]|uniref:Putative Cytochrome P450 n=1 Tax=Aspergillus mulundensis TaxID=1810919 RepID=A0A3D8S698_9EURO|nr:putative Cytochrome P450 [Aspergillus mulundensis]RDW81591.1 putative Cytochrome P450 [Aspergillus mulundensis]
MHSKRSLMQLIALFDPLKAGSPAAFLSLDRGTLTLGNIEAIMTPATILLTVPLGLFLIYFLKQSFTKRTTAPLPPGPPPKPLIGNLRDLPSPDQQSWAHWLKHKDLYGPISSLTVFGQTIVIINEARIAFDLLEKRSTIYSSRPRMVFAGEMYSFTQARPFRNSSLFSVLRIGWEHSLAMQPYSDTFRAYRKAMHRVLGTKNAISQFDQLQEVEVRRLLLRILKKPDNLVHHIRTATGAVILKIAYGYDIAPHGDDPLVALANKTLDQFSLAATPGAWIVDTIPALRYLPSWIPGAGFQRTAETMRDTLRVAVEKPYRFVLKQMESGRYSHSYLSNLLSETKEGSQSAEEEQVNKWTATSIYTGGADTTVSALSTFFLAMALHPHVQQKAQAELDAVLSPHNLPSLTDRPRLPYIEAVAKETLRWHPVGPMGIPHTCTEDNIYNNYLIPQGALVMPNIWAFTHDPAVYRDASAFNPSRFLGPTPEADPANLAFGFGRRICPGRLLADSSLFLAIAQVLAVFEIRIASEASAKTEFLPGVISHPVLGGLDVRPRSWGHEELVRGVEVDYPFGVGSVGELEGIVI